MKINKESVGTVVGVASLFILIVFSVEFSLQKIWISSVIKNSEMVIEGCRNFSDLSVRVGCLESYIDRRNESAENGVNSYWISIVLIISYLVFQKIKSLFVGLKK